MQLDVIKKRVFGRIIMYVHGSPEMAAAIRRLTGHKTVNQEELDALSVLGMDINVIDPYTFERDLWEGR